MRYSVIVSILVLFFLSLSTPPVSAETRYVGDQLVITLRLGKSTQHKIIKTLKTGTPLEILEEGQEYLKVRTPDGTEGYVLKQYISSEPPKALRIKELEERNSSLQNKITGLEENNKNLAQQLKACQENNQQTISELQMRSAELEKNLEQAITSEGMMAEKYDTLLEQSGNVIEIAEERDLLSQRNSKLQKDLAAISQKNEKLSDARMIKWFLAGGGVFFFGWIIGKISRKKRSRF